MVYSCLDAASKNVGWVRGGSDISYYSNSYSRANNAGEGVSNYYTLSFTLEFQYAQDTVLCAYTYPYTHADYKAQISKIMSRPNSADIVRTTTLCKTLSGEDCDLGKSKSESKSESEVELSFISILVVSCFMWSGALDKSGVL